ncbi:hypothetical protein [Pseudaestuariivita rosea]|uniref:hypothetical protein n=1 Tax=Pseudaestuariivita rosea TaxID=2763263 RepID=UPI001F24FB81|nr:hypothetical protein [Pseudaestuariivita rosea]
MKEHFKPLSTQSQMAAVAISMTAPAMAFGAASLYFWRLAMAAPALTLRATWPAVSDAGTVDAPAADIKAAPAKPKAAPKAPAKPVAKKAVAKKTAAPKVVQPKKAAPKKAAAKKAVVEAVTTAPVKVAAVKETPVKEVAAKEAPVKKATAKKAAKPAAKKAEKPATTKPQIKAVAPVKSEPAQKETPVKAAPAAKPVKTEVYEAKTTGGAKKVQVTLAAMPEPKVDDSKPALLKAARNGKADDLKLIKGVGPKMEKQLNDLGIYHFDQVAGLTDTQLDWVDDQLNGLKGMPKRNNWVSQAKDLAKTK